MILARDIGTWGWIKFKHPSDGLPELSGPGVYPSDCPTNTMDDFSVYICSMDDYNENWEENSANVEISTPEGEVVGITTRIGRDSEEGIGMAEPLLSELSTSLYSPLLLTIENFESEIVLQNPTNDDVDATVQFYTLDGDLADTEDLENIAPHASVTLLANDYLIGESGAYSV